MPVAVALALALAGASAAPPEAAGRASGVSAAAEALAGEIGPPRDGRRAVALAVEPRASPLSGPVEAAVEAALGARGYAVVPVRDGADAEAQARSAGQDWLVRVHAALVPGRRELALVAEVIPAWTSFFLQRRPGARAVAPRLVQARVAADPATLALGRAARAPGAPFARVRRLASLPGRVLALAVGDLPEAGGPAIAVALEDADLVLSARGDPIARRTLDASARQPIRAPGAATAIGALGPGRLAVAHAGAPGADVLAVRGDRLEPVGRLEAAPLCAGSGGPLFGAFVPGTSMIADALAPRPDAIPAPRSPRALYGVACAPQSGPVAFAALGADLKVELLGTDLRTATHEAAHPEPLDQARDGRSRGTTPTAILQTGTAFALADLDGDGVPELVASDPAPTSSDHVRVLSLQPGAAPLVVSEPLAGELLAGAAGDLTGDGIDDAVLALVGRGDAGQAETVLLLVTSDGGSP
ncbi:MAG TPA: VCBS repeat-containing protein [Anaeromyxobacter sp.]|nr:VCBS repeat-containing protein [Anaeromyxobacter sp.]